MRSTFKVRLLDVSKHIIEKNEGIAENGKLFVKRAMLLHTMSENSQS